MTERRTSLSPAPAGDRPLIVICVDADDPRRLLGAELERRYGADYQIVATARPGDAVDVVRDAAASGSRLALLIADAPGSVWPTALFTAAREAFPDVRRALLIEWGSWSEPEVTRGVLELMAAVKIDYYLVRPRRQRDEYFHRAIVEFLLDWDRATRPAGTEAEPEDSGIADRAVSAGSAAAAGAAAPTPVVDVAVVGGGPAGLAAALTAAAEGLSVVLLENGTIGGQAGSSSLIRNYLGFPRGVSGADLADRAYQQAWAFGATFAHSSEAVGLARRDGLFELAVPGEAVVRARSVVLAMGVSYRRLAVAELEPYAGTAVFYGVSSVEARAQSGRSVHVVGGGNSAGQAALHLSRYAGSVSLIVRGAVLAESMSGYLVDQLAAAGVTILTESRIVGGGSSGDGEAFDHLVVQNRRTGDEVVVPSDAVFITIGAAPRTGWLDGVVQRDKWGSISTALDASSSAGPLETSVPGVFAVGDVRRSSVKRVASAVGEGSVVIPSVHSWLARSPVTAE